MAVGDRTLRIIGLHRRGTVWIRIASSQIEMQLDRFKMQLGLPPDMEVEIDDSLLKPFLVRNARLTALEDRVRGLEDEVVALQTNPAAEHVRNVLQQLETLEQDFVAGFAEVEDAFQRLEDILPRRLYKLDDNGAGKLRANNAADLQTLAEMHRRFEAATRLLAQLKQQMQQGNPAAPQWQQMAVKIASARESLAQVARKLNGLRSVLQVKLIAMVPIDLSPDEAVKLALEHRLDLMNRRGSVMDARRRLEVAADRLEATLDVVVEGELNTPPLADNNRPFDFREDDSVFRAGVEVVTPLDRRAQRNDFRAAEVSYQRARRNYMTAEDQVKLDVRQSLRRVTMEGKYFEIARRAFRVAVRELEQAVEQAESNGHNGEATSGQGLNIPRAIGNIFNAQDYLIETWVDYETARLTLARDTGVMKIDENGVWPEKEQAKWSCSNAKFPFRLCPRNETLPPEEDTPTEQ